MSRYDLGVVQAGAHDLDPAGITRALSRDLPDPRPRDLTLTAARAADRPTRPRPITSYFA